MIIGRKEEIHYLDSIVNKNDAQLVVIYGRRRVGKTFLINEYFNNNFAFKITGINESDKVIELQAFSLSLLRKGYEIRKNIDNWFTAFDMLRDYLENYNNDEKQVVFFDEMPWLDTQKSKFREAFENFWNDYGSTNKKLVFICCGSSSSWITNNIIDNKGGLFNRHSARIFLEPFNLKETEDFLISKNIIWSRYDICVCYMALGGIPYYLNLLDESKTLNENIDELFFKKHSLLFDEYDKLYKTLFKNHEIYEKIVEALFSSGKMTIKEISVKTKIPQNGNLTKILNDLYYSGFVSMEVRNGNRKENVYKLDDYFTIFYLKFVHDKNGIDEKYFENSYNDKERTIWMGYAFERICFSHIKEIKKAIGISDVLSNEYSFKYIPIIKEENGAQIDMIIERKDNIISICEIKFSLNEFRIDKDYYMNIRNKIDVFISKMNKRKTIQVVFITTFGVKKNEYSNIVNKNITLDDLFS